MANRLANENSLYLKQHQDNPVDWWPWCPEAFEKAKEENKPVIVSVGYSACHWCHVMAHECFEDEYIADLMNRHFICIKVDREERPDVDQIYMDAVQMINQHGGWPLNAFCLPDGKPFFGGTYFPPEDKGHGIIPWPQLLIRISEHYTKKKEELEQNAENIVKNITANNNPFKADNEAIPPQSLIDAAKAICDNHDDEWGGFGEAPKFPPSMALNFLLAIRSTKTCQEDASFAGRIDTVVQRTLRAMARGGIYDQVGGGFARYSVDDFWLIPHFEKMIYDNGLLIDIFLKGWMRYRNDMFKSVIEETIEWLQREMEFSDGGFAASLDADSEGEEGKFYVWTPDEIISILGKDEGEKFCKAYNISERGNFEHGTSNPALAEDDYELRQSFQDARKKLLETRNKRIAPGKDTKLILSWNSLIIKALVEAGYYMERPEWIELARKTADTIWEKLRYDDNKLRAVAYGDLARFDATLDDYANYADACLTLASKIDSTHVCDSGIYIERARITADVVIEQFKDSENPGFYFTGNDSEKLAGRKKDWLDNAVPAGNSTMIHVFSCLNALLEEPIYENEINELSRAYKDFSEKAPNAVPNALAGLTTDLMGIAVVKIKDVNVMPGLHKSMVLRPWRKTFLIVTKDREQEDDYILCVGKQCMPPTDNPHRVADMI